MTTEQAGSAAGATRAVRRPVEHEVLLSALPHPILVLAADNGIIFVNQSAEHFVASSQAVLKRQRLDDLVAFGSPLLALVEQVRRDGASVNEYGMEIVMPRIETARLVDVFAGPLAEPSGQIVVMLQSRSMAQMIERQLTHRSAARSVSGLAAILAHEIKNPLSGIRGAAQLIEPSLSDEDRVFARLICEETERIRKLVDRMEVFGDERPLVKEPINIHDVLDHVRRLAETGFASGLTIQVNYDPSLPAVPGHRDKLIQAVLNLVKNAAEAVLDQPAGSGAPGRIVLSTSFRPGIRLSVPGSTTRISLPLAIEVEDNGPGVAAHMKAHLFDPFVTTKRTGTGLGLALVAKIVSDHGGIIECESEPRRTVFRVMLPLETTGKPANSRH
jgi:two-component system, NtrC family, nitrogen regulation sensor histidine kinase GlnL